MRPQHKSPLRMTGNGGLCASLVGGIVSTRCVETPPFGPIVSFSVCSLAPGICSGLVVGPEATTSAFTLSGTGGKCPYSYVRAASTISLRRRGQSAGDCTREPSLNKNG